MNIVIRAGKKLADAVLAPAGLELVQKGISQFPEVTPDEVALVRRFQPYTMTTERRAWALLKSIHRVDRAAIPGDIVECGVWRGGNIMMAKAARAGSEIPRRYFLFDTFTGMPEPSEHDVATDGRAAARIYAARKKEGHTDWLYASLEDVQANFDRFGLLGDDVIFRKGLVQDTLKSGELPERIAILRLDTDFFESTKVELEVLYPRLSPGGVLIIDDYGSWLGSKKAVDEYFGNNLPLLIPIDRCCRMTIRT